MPNKSPIKAWIEASRPKTLAASFSPVLVGCALAVHDNQFQWIPAILCFLVALFAQIASNLANDYFDFKKGADREDRLGPERAVASGWITPKAMLAGTLLTLGAACLFGLILVLMTRWELIFVGVAIALCVLAYSAGPFPLAYNGLGDVCVLLFYGLIPVTLTYYVQAMSITTPSILLSLAMGFLSINILIVNNYRDYEQDKASKKRTTIVLFGRKFGRVAYLLNGFLAILFTFPILIDQPWWSWVLVFFFVVVFQVSWLDMRRQEGKVLNKTLASTSRNVLIFAVIISYILIRDSHVYQ